MKSKILKTVGLIAAMVACIGMTVFAEPSPAASTVVTGVNSATDKDGKPVEGITITSDIPAEYSQRACRNDKPFAPPPRRRF